MGHSGTSLNFSIILDHNQGHVEKLLKYMNSRHQNIKFTFKEEHDNKIAFLDISITRAGNELQTSLFRRKHLVVYI